MKTIEEKAQAYANRNFAIQVGEIPSIKVDISDHLKRAYIAGTTEALAGQWRSVEDGLPKENDEVVVIFTHPIHPNFSEYAVAYWDGEDWYTNDGEHIRPTHWMSIPEPPKDESE